jgi:hypothetical protein
MYLMATLLFSTLCPVQYAATIVNGDFETGDLRGWTQQNTANGTTAVAEVVTFDIDGPGPLPPSKAARFSVGQVAPSSFFAGIDFSQDLDLIGGQTYRISGNIAVQNIGNMLNGSGGDFILSVFRPNVFNKIVDETNIGQINASSSRFSVLNGTFTPPVNGMYTMDIRIQRGGTVPMDNTNNLTLFQYLDNVAISEVPAGTPEPGTLALMSLGLLVLFAWWVNCHRHRPGSEVLQCPPQNSQPQVSIQ